MTEASRFDEDWLDVRLGSIWREDGSFIFISFRTLKMMNPTSF